MAQQDPCWIDLQSLLKSSTPSTAENQLSQHCLCQCCRGKEVQLLCLSFRLVRKDQMCFLHDFFTINTKEAGEVRGPLSFCLSFILHSAALRRAFTLHCKTTARNSTKPVLEKVLGTPKVLHS